MGFGERLSKLRKELNLTQEKLAEQIGVKYQVISRYERNEIRPSYEFIKKIMMLFPEKIHWLILGDELSNNVLNIIDSDKNLIINLNNYNNEKEIEIIIKLLEYAPRQYLDKIKSDLEKLKAIVDNYSKE